MRAGGGGRFGYSWFGLLEIHISTSDLNGCIYYTLPAMNKQQRMKQICNGKSIGKSSPP